VRARDEAAGQREALRVLADDQGRIAGDVNELQSAHQEGDAFAAAGRPAVEGLEAFEVEELLLLVGRLVRAELIGEGEHGGVGRTFSPSV
jgi:hypothetical protein